MNSLKLTLASGVTVLALSAAAMAQTAGSNRVYTSQTGIGTAGSPNTMEITQTGDSNFAGLSEGERLAQAVGAGNALVVNQNGSGNVVGRTTGLSGFNPDGIQSGAGNTLRIDQTNTGNEVKYRQIGTNNGQVAAVNGGNGYNGMSPYGAGTSPVGGGNAYGGATPTGLWNYIGQTSSNGRVSLSQTANGAANGVIINQAGGSSIDLTQTTLAGVTAPNYAYFSQTGNTNTAALTQTATGGAGNVADIRQSDSDRTVMFSAVTATQSGSMLDLYVNQSGAYNTATTTQTGADSSVMSIFQVGTGTSGARSDLNRVDATQQSGSGMQLFASQNGFGNYLLSVQSGTGAMATVMQTGNSNRVESLSQDGMSFANLTQTGTSNTLSSVSQSGSSASSVTISQIGNGNSGLSAQSGGYQYALVNQTGSSGSTFSNSQSGSGMNSFILAQADGGLHMATSTQSGFMLTALVDQSGTNNTYVGMQSGNNNRSDVAQGMTMNVANVAQSGAYNTATIRQNR